MEGSIMGQVRHGSATTTFAVRAAMQRSQTSIAELSREVGINLKIQDKEFTLIRYLPDVFR
jgi:hypothetical protein